MANARLGWFSPLGLAASIRVAAGRVGLRAHCFRFSACTASEIAARRVGLRAHCFRFSACTASEIALGGLAFGLTASAFRHAPLRRLPSAGWPSGSRLPLFGTHRFGVALGGLVLPPSASEIAARRVDLRAPVSVFRHAPIRGCRSAGWCFRWAGWPSGSQLPLFGTRRFGVAARRVGLRAHRFRFSARTASGLPSASWFFCLLLRSCRSAGWPSGSRLPLFGMRRFGDCPRRVGSSAFRFGDCRSAGWPSGSRLPLFGTHRSAPPHRRREGRRSTPTRHLFHFKTLIPTC